MTNEREYLQEHILETAILMSLSLAKNERNYLIVYYGIGEGEAAVVREIAYWATQLEGSLSEDHWEERDWYEEIDAFIENKVKEYSNNLSYLIRGNKKDFNFHWVGIKGMPTEDSIEKAQLFKTKKEAEDFLRRQKYRLKAKIVEVYQGKYRQINVLPS